MNLNIVYGFKTNKYVELNSSPTNCQCPEMGSHFEFLTPNIVQFALL
jgi:hypothetical protein